MSGRVKIDYQEERISELKQLLLTLSVENIDFLTKALAQCEVDLPLHTSLT